MYSDLQAGPYRLLNADKAAEKTGFFAYKNEETIKSKGGLICAGKLPRCNGGRRGKGSSGPRQEYGVQPDSVQENPEYMNRPPDLGDESSAAPVSK